MAGRQSYSARAQNANATLSKAGTQTAAALAERVYNAYDVMLKVKKIHVALGTAPTGASFIVDIKINGTTIFAAAGDRPTVLVSTNAAVAVPTKTDLDAISVKPGQYLTAEVTQIGSGTAGADLRVTVLFG